MHPTRLQFLATDHIAELRADAARADVVRRAFEDRRVTRDAEAPALGRSRPSHKPAELARAVRSAAQGVLTSLRRAGARQA